MPAMPRSSAAGATSTIVTASPACAATCAMPCPIVPAPTTPMLLTADIEGTLSAVCAKGSDVDDVAVIARANESMRALRRRQPGLAAAELRRQRGADADERRHRPRPHADPRQQL